MTEKFKEQLAAGRLARQEARLPASRAIFLDVVRKASEDGDRSSLAEALWGLADAEDEIGNCEEARHLFANAAALYRQIGPPRMLASALRREADLCMKMGRPLEAEPLRQEAAAIESGDQQPSESA